MCFKRGHIALDCWYKYDSNYTSSLPPSQPPFQAYVAQPGATVGSYATTPSSTEWYIDSSATHHVTNDVNNLSSFMPYDGFDALQIGNGTGMPITHIGSVSFSFSNHKLILRDVLHVHSFTKNLLSPSKLLNDNSLLIEFSSSFCVIKDRHTLIPLIQAKLSSGLYSITFVPDSLPQVYFGERVSADRWYARLGHPAFYYFASFTFL